MIKTVYVNIPSYIEDSNYRYKMPKPQLKIEGRGNGIKTNIINLHEIAKALRCHDQYPLKYLGFEFGSQTSYKFKNDNDVTCIINGAFQDEQIRKMLDKFIEKYILCQKCKYPEMFMKIKGGKVIFGQCDSCGHFSDLDNAHRLASYILKNPPGENQSIKNTHEELQILAGGNEEKKEKPKKKKVVAAEVEIGSELLQQFLDALRDTYSKLVINDTIDKDMADMMLSQDIKKFNLDKSLKDRVCYLLFQSMFDAIPVNALERNYEILTNYFNELDPDLAQCHIMLNIEWLMKNRNIEDKYFCTILKGFYDYSYIEDQYLIKWFDNTQVWKEDSVQNFLYKEEIDQYYRQLSEPMINWLRYYNFKIRTQMEQTEVYEEEQEVVQE